MARRSASLLVVSVAMAVAALLGSPAFTGAWNMAPSAARDVSRKAASASSDAIGNAAAELSKAAYSFMTQVDWNSPEYWMVPGSDAMTWAKAIGKILDHGASMDGELVKAGCKAHYDAINGLPANGVCSEAQLTAMNAAIGRMIASAPEAKTMAVYDAVKPLISPKVPPYLMSKVNEKDAKAAYEALIKFTQVVKANPITPSTPKSSVPSESASAIDAAAGKLAKISYPFMKGVDWLDGLWGETVPAPPQKTLKAINSMIKMGAEMDSAALKEATLAHVKAIEGMDSKAVMKEADYKAILAGIGKTVASVPSSSVMSVFYAMGDLVGLPGIPNYVYSKQNPADALAAYKGFMEFKETVKVEQGKIAPSAPMDTFSYYSGFAIVSLVVFSILKIM